VITEKRTEIAIRLAANRSGTERESDLRPGEPEKSVSNLALGTIRVRHDLSIRRHLLAPAEKPSQRVGRKETGRQ